MAEAAQETTGSMEATDVCVSEDEDSILTNGRTDAWYEYDDEDDDSYGDDDEEWKNLQDHLNKRSAILSAALERKINVSKTSSLFYQQIRRRDQHARLVRERAAVHIIKDKRPLLQQRQPRDDPESQSLSVWLRIGEAISFEFRTFGKAALCLILHSIAMGSFFETVKATFDICYSNLSVILVSESASFNFLLHSLVLITGLLLLRSTGYLYWWLKDTDYDLLKFDYHNRLQLNFSEARFIALVRSRVFICLFAYLIGYNLVYAVAIYLHSMFDWFLSQQALLDNVPSKQYVHNKLDAIFLCDRTCTEVMEDQKQQELFLLQADYDYTRRTLSATSHATYWLNYVHSTDYMGSEENTAHTDFTEIFASVCVFVVCVWLLYCYGFLFWRTF